MVGSDASVAVSGMARKSTRRGRRMGVSRISFGWFGLCLILLALPAAAQEPAPLVQPPLPVGTKITQQNWQQYKSYMPQGLIEILGGTHPWRLPPDFVMEVGPNREYPNPK